MKVKANVKVKPTRHFDESRQTADRKDSFRAFLPEKNPKSGETLIKI